jgi:hypothetical protein
MPGEYSYSVSAFGYSGISGSGLSITGGQDNAYAFELTPSGRGSITGVVNGAGSPLSDADITIAGTPLASLSDSSGDFGMTDVPYSNYTVNISADGYCSTSVNISVSSPLTNLGTIDLRAITLADHSLGHWVATAWNKVEEVPGTFFTDNYKVTCTYGVFDFISSVSIQQSGTAAHINSIEMTVTGWKWYYYSVSSSFSFADLAFSRMDEVVDGAGDLCSLLVDEYDGGFFDFLEANIGAGGAGGSTVVRVDSVQLRNGDSVVWDSHDGRVQSYSTDGPFAYGINSDVSSLANVSIRMYVKVMNQDYGIGPLYLRDKMMFEWKWNGSRFQLQGLTQNPIDYPSF